MKHLKSFLSVLCTAFLLVFTAVPVSAASSVTYDDLSVDQNSIVVLYTNDMHGGISNDTDYTGTSDSIGLAGVAAVKADALKEAAAVTTVDAGDALQGSILCSQSKGSEMLDLMNQVGYDYQVFGNHEFDYGMETALSYIDQSKAEYLGVNFKDLTSGEEVFQPYAIKEYSVNGKTLKIGYVGILTPESIAKGTPKYFQDADGNFIYSLDADTTDQFYSTVQTAIDSARKDGAQYIIALGHLGDTGITEGWSSPEMIANTTGIDVFLDGHSHSVNESESVRNKEGNEVLLSSTGTKLENLGALIIQVGSDGVPVFSTHLINAVTDSEKESESYQSMASAIQALEDKYSYLMVEEGNTDYDLCITNPDTGKRMVRTQETNLGDYVADAFKNGLNAEIGVVNGGSVRADLEKGTITFLDITNVLPYTESVDKIQASGQVILDCLEMGARLYPEECGGFMQVSGITYSIDSEVPSTVETDAQGMFVKVNGDYRVKDVKVNGEDLDLSRTYTVAISDYYYSQSGDGMTMFKDCAKDTEEPYSMIDRDLFISYLAKNDNAVPASYENITGEGRITILPLETAEPSATPSASAETVTEPAQTQTSYAWVWWIVGIAAGAGVFWYIMKKKKTEQK